MGTGRISRRNHQINKRNRLKAEGLCVRCGKNKAVENRFYCSDCAKKHSEEKKKIRRAITPLGFAKAFCEEKNKEDDIKVK